MTSIRMVHLADIHLGYTGPANLMLGDADGRPDLNGRYVREVDIEEAVKAMTRRILAAQPAVDVVVIAGDLFHRSSPLPRAVRLAAGMVRRLVEKGIEVVIVDGNHETSSWLHTGSPTAFLTELGAHTVQGGECKVLRDAAWQVNPRLRDGFAVHALPYQAVVEGAFAGVRPLSGYLNVLVSHGRVQGMEDPNTLGTMTRSLPGEVLARGWDYVALGDCHFHAHRPLAHAPAYYAGSLEALNYGEAAFYPPHSDDRNAKRGALDVRLSPGQPAQIHLLEHKGRPVLRLPAIDASDLDAASVMRQIRQRLSPDLPREALVVLEVNNCPATLYERLKFDEIDRLRQQVRRCDIRWDVVHPEWEAREGLDADDALDQQWVSFIEQAVPDPADRGWYAEHGWQRIEAAIRTISSAQLEAGEE